MSLSTSKFRKLFDYIRKHPDVSFTFQYFPDGITNVKSEISSVRVWSIKFSKPIASKSLIGYGCSNLEQLIDSVIEERETEAYKKANEK